MWSRTGEQVGCRSPDGCGQRADPRYLNNQITTQTISDEICLPFYNIIDKALMLLKQEELIEVTGSSGFGELAYQYIVTPKGVIRVHQVMDQATYVGPAPVTLGNGKTVLAEHIIPLLGGHVLIPYAFTVDGQIIKVLDFHNHEPVPLPERGRPEFDRRFVLCRRPVIITGGELTLDLVYDNISKVYEAPLQVKANGGMFLIDDFGRQQVQPRQLLNRWIVPLEKRVDYLTLHTGKKIEMPFDQLIVFSTNLAPRDLVDEAFLRRIQNTIHITNPSVEAYREIFRRVCEQLGIPFDQNGLVYLVREYYVKTKRELRSVHPRDILRILVGISRYLDVPPRLTPQLLDGACETYFVDL